jgi:hypothetical protein
MYDTEKEFDVGELPSATLLGAPVGVAATAAPFVVIPLFSVAAGASSIRELSEGHTATGIVDGVVALAPYASKTVRTGIANRTSLLRAASMESAGAAAPAAAARQAAAFLWASAAARARIYLLSGLEPEIVEELFATPLDNAGQAQRLLAGAASCLVLEDAHKTMAVLSATAAEE